jgi:hypothetical protein
MREKRQRTKGSDGAPGHRAKQELASLRGRPSFGHTGCDEAELLSSTAGRIETAGRRSMMGKASSANFPLDNQELSVDQ